MPSSTASGPSTTPENETLNVRKRMGSELSDDGRKTKKVKVETSLSSKLKAKEKDKRKKKRRRKTRRSSVVIVETERSTSKPRSTTTQPTSAPQALSSATDPADAEPEEKVVSSVDKGKGKATSPEPGLLRVASPSIQPEASTSTAHYASEIARLKEQVASQAELIQRHETHLNASQQSLTCQICLDLLYKPYALAPCGHITCYECLVRWFTAPANITENHLQGQPIEQILSGTLARNGAYLRRKKNCPVCRANVVERPAELWDIKGMVQALVRSKLVEIPVTAEEPTPPPPPAAPAEAVPIRAAGPSNANANNDPWRGIFPVRPARAGGALDDFGFDFFLPQHMGVHDAEDGGIYRCIDCHNEILDGECTGCGREYAGHLGGGDTDHSDDEDDGWFGNARIRALLEEHDEDDDDLDDDDDDPDHLAFVPPHFWGGGHPIFHLPDGDDLSDEEDDEEGRIFEVATEVATDVDEDGEEDGSDHRIYEVEDDEDGYEDNEDSQYGGSFIDDDEPVEIIANDRNRGSDDSDGNVEFVELLDIPLRGNVRRPIVVTSDNEEGDTELEEDDEVAPSRAPRFWSTAAGHANDEVTDEDDVDDEDEDKEEDKDAPRHWLGVRRTRRRLVAVDGTDEEDEEE